MEIYRNRHIQKESYAKVRRWNIPIFRYSLLYSILWTLLVGCVHKLSVALAVTGFMSIFVTNPIALALLPITVLLILLVTYMMLANLPVIARNMLAGLAVTGVLRYIQANSPATTAFLPAITRVLYTSLTSPIATTLAIGMACVITYAAYTALHTQAAIVNELIGAMSIYERGLHLGFVVGIVIGMIYYTIGFRQITVYSPPIGSLTGLCVQTIYIKCGWNESIFNTSIIAEVTTYAIFTSVIIKALWMFKII